MTDTIVDTNVLLDVAREDSVWQAWSEARLAEAAEIGELIINQIVYSELAAGYPRREEVDELFTTARFKRENLPWDAAFAAGVAFLAYRRRGGQRGSPPPDFYIGAHAAVNGYRLLTRDRGHYRAYFPSVVIVTPETRP